MPKASIDIATFYAALDRQRQDAGLSWRALGRELEIPASTFTRLSNGAGPDVDAFAVLVHWLGTPVSTFLVPPLADSERQAETESTVDTIDARLRGDPRLTADAADAIARIVRVAYEALRTDREVFRDERVSRNDSPPDPPMLGGER